MKTLLLTTILSLNPNLKFDAKAICGADDRQYVEVFEDVNDWDVDLNWVRLMGDSVARVGGCSATLIDEDVIITAHHCKLKIGQHVYFNYVRGEDIEGHFHIEKRLEAFHDLDTDIFRLDGKPDRPYRELTLEIPEKNKGMAYIIGHPEGRRMQISAGVMKMVGRERVGYLADSMGGSSGAGTLDKEGRMFAVHQWGACHTSLGYNGGTPLSAIRHLSRILSELIPE